MLTGLVGNVVTNIACATLCVLDVSLCYSTTLGVKSKLKLAVLKDNVLRSTGNGSVEHSRVISCSGLLSGFLLCLRNLCLFQLLGCGNGVLLVLLVLSLQLFL